MATRRKPRPPPPSMRTPTKAEARKREKPRTPGDKKVRPPSYLYIGSPEQEALLVEELGATARPIAAGMVAADIARDPVFARQRLTAPKLMTAPTRDELATALIALIDKGDVSPRLVHVFAQELPRQGSASKAEHPLAHDAKRLQETLVAKLEGRRRLGKLGPETPHMLQVAMVGPTEGYVCIEECANVAADDDALADWPVPFCAGRAVDEASRDAPSSAHRKLNESMAWLGTDVGPDDIVVDLGAAPGGWTRVMRDRGARVVAVDRAALDDVLARDPMVTHVKTDALSVKLKDYTPTVVLCDVIWTPDNAITIARRVLESKTVRAAVITLKLKNPIDWDTLQRAQSLVRDLPSNWTGRVKHLMANKLEVTLLLRRSAA